MYKLKKSTWPSFDYKDASKISQILLSNKVNYWTGNEGKKFEKEFAKFANTKYAIAVSNGTVALDLALKLLNLKKNDEVIVTPRSFIASVSSVINCGATPVFADIDINSGNICLNTISKVITKKTKAIICVHIAGFPCAMDKIMKFAKKKSLKVIEDCSQAHGAKIKNKSVGSFGDISAWSFCQEKNITTGGEGGMITTNSYRLWKKCWSLKDHGKNYKEAFFSKSKGYKWLHHSFGGNYRLTEFQSALGRIQLKKINTWNNKRNFNSKVILDELKKYKGLVNIPNIPKDYKHAWYRCCVSINKCFLKKNWTRDKIIDELSIRGIGVNIGSCPEIYLEKAFKNKPYKPKRRLVNAKVLGETNIAFLVHPTISSGELLNIKKSINQVFQRAYNLNRN
jgi:dTDP-4-amino-4,6-dideoxygalactose transaminase